MLDSKRVLHHEGGWLEARYKRLFDQKSDESKRRTDISA
jgi:hypothetical protein